MEEALITRPSRFVPLTTLALVLAACSSTPPQVVKSINNLPPPPVLLPQTHLPATPQSSATKATVDYKEFNYTQDGGPETPVDVSQVPEAEPTEEEPAKYGNKSPYTVLGNTYKVLPSSEGFTQIGKASWYGRKFHGMKTSSGEVYDMFKMTAAHRNLPLPTYARITNLTNNKSVIVKINDRGPFHSNRILDLSYAAASRLDIIREGTATVRIDVINFVNAKNSPNKTDESQALAKVDSSPVSVVRTVGSVNTTSPNNAGSNANNSASSNASSNNVISSNDAGSNDANSDDASDSGAPHFYVQVGAFGVINNATTLQTRLSNIVYDTPVMIASDDSHSGINRVQIGPFSTRADAEKISGLIRNNALGQPFIVWQ